MTYEVNGRTLETTDSGYLVNQDDWDKDVALAIAAAEGLSLIQDRLASVELHGNARAFLKALL